MSDTINNKMIDVVKFESIQNQHDEDEEPTTYPMGFHSWEYPFCNDVFYEIIKDYNKIDNSKDFNVHIENTTNLMDSIMLCKCDPDIIYKTLDKWYSDTFNDMYPNKSLPAICISPYDGSLSSVCLYADIVIYLIYCGYFEYIPKDLIDISYLEKQIYINLYFSNDGKIWKEKYSSLPNNKCELNYNRTYDAIMKDFELLALVKNGNFVERQEYISRSYLSIFSEDKLYTTEWDY